MQCTACTGNRIISNDSYYCVGELFPYLDLPFQTEFIINQLKNALFAKVKPFVTHNNSLLTQNAQRIAIWIIAQMLERTSWERPSYVWKAFDWILKKTLVLVNNTCYLLGIQFLLRLHEIIIMMMVMMI